MKKYYPLVFIFLVLIGCTEYDEEQVNIQKEKKKEVKMLRPEKQEEINVRIGESFKNFYTEHPKGSIKRVGNDKFGYTTFYKYNWNINTQKTIVVSYADINVSFPNTIRMKLIEESEYSHKGIMDISLQTGITAADIMTYEESRVKFYAFLQKLLTQGWKRAINIDGARISGRQAMHYKLTEDDMYCQDPSYEPTLEEWKRLETGGMTGSNYWVLHYNSKIFLEIQLGVVPHKTDSTLASYLMFIEISDGEKEAKMHTAPDERMEWKKLWKERLIRATKNRTNREVKAKAKGYTIDDTYGDYVINPEDY